MNMEKQSLGFRLQNLKQYPAVIPLLGLVILIVLMSFSGNNFFSITTFSNIVRQISINAILASGMTLVILTGGIDLSVGAVLALSGTIMAGIIIGFKGVDISPSIVLMLGWGGAIVVSIICGAFSGFFISRFGLPAIIVTLAMMEGVRGIALSYTGGYPMSIPRAFSALGREAWMGIPIPAWIMLIVFLIGYIILSKIRLGRYIYAVGSNEDAAVLSGIRTKLVHLFVYMYCGFTAGIAGIIATSRVSSGQANAGMGFELDAIAAVVLGGTSIMGGKGSIVGTLIGACILGVLNTGLNTLGVPPYPQRIIKGAIILAAVLIGIIQKQKKN